MAYSGIYGIIFYTFPIAEICISGYNLLLFIKPFAEKRKTALCAGISYFAVMLLLYTMPLYMESYIAYAAGISAVFIVICCIEQKNYKQKIFLVVVFFSLNGFSAAMAGILYDNLYDFILGTGCISEQGIINLVLYMAVSLFYLVLEFLFTFICIKCILKVYPDKYVDMSEKELFMLATPLVMGITGYGIMRYYRRFYILETGSIINIYDALVLLYCAVSFITVMLVIDLYQNMKTKQEEKLQAGMFAVQIGNIRKHVRRAENMYNDIHSIKHDMANHILTLERLYKAGNAEEAMVYSAKLKERLKGIKSGVKSGNPITDVILQELKNEAMEMGINFNSRFFYPEGSGIDVFDISIILNNALQNAIENTEKSKEGFISVISYRRNNAYMIEISNSFKGNLRWNTQNGLIFTSKEDKEGHGYGLSNIRKVAQKYSGDIDIVADNGKFCLCIILMME